MLHFLLLSFFTTLVQSSITGPIFYNTLSESPLIAFKLNHRTIISSDPSWTATYYESTIILPLIYTSINELNHKVSNPPFYPNIPAVLRVLELIASLLSTEIYRFEEWMIHNEWESQGAKFKDQSNPPLRIDLKSVWKEFPVVFVDQIPRDKTHDTLKHHVVKKSNIQRLEEMISFTKHRIDGSLIGWNYFKSNDIFIILEKCELVVREIGLNCSRGEGCRALLDRIETYCWGVKFAHEKSLKEEREMDGTSDLFEGMKLQQFKKSTYMSSSIKSQDQQKECGILLKSGKDKPEETEGNLQSNASQINDDDTINDDDVDDAKGFRIHIKNLK